MSNVRVGRLAKWQSGKNSGNGYGFIRSGGSDIFVHFSAYLPGFTPELNQLVEYELGPANKEHLPAQACRVRVIKSADKVLAEFNAGLDKLSEGNDPKAGV